MDDGRLMSLLDLDRRGCVRGEYLIKALGQCGVNLSDEDASKLVGMFDVDDDGDVCMYEFWRFMGRELDEFETAADQDHGDDENDDDDDDIEDDIDVDIDVDIDMDGSFEEGEEEVTKSSPPLSPAKTSSSNNNSPSKNLSSSSPTKENITASVSVA